MKITLARVLQTACSLGASLVLACGSDAATPITPSGASATSDAQTPPTGTDAEITTWLAKGEYKSWKCEPEVHAGRPPSPHGRNRVCSNALLSDHGSGEFPIGSAGVKEIYDAAGTTITGYATYRKIAAGAGDAWYWYEKLGGSVVANSLGNTGCTGCHSRAGTGTNSGHDFVYTQVK